MKGHHFSLQISKIVLLENFINFKNFSIIVVYLHSNGNRPLVPVPLFFSLISFVCHPNPNRLLSYLFTSPAWLGEVRWGKGSHNDVHLSLFCPGLAGLDHDSTFSAGCQVLLKKWESWRECKSGVQEIWSNQSALWRFSMILTFHAASTSPAWLKVNIHLKMWWINLNTNSTSSSSSASGISGPDGVPGGQ